jgi:DNA invertase Pin-like site-specific DNA recombinase
MRKKGQILLSNAELKELEGLYHSGWIHRDLCEKFNISQGTLINYIRVGLVRRLDRGKLGSRSYFGKYAKELKDAVKLADKGLSVKAIADEIGVAYATVRWWGLNGLITMNYIHMGDSTKELHLSGEELKRYHSLTKKEKQDFVNQLLDEAYTYRAIGEALGTSRQRVHQISNGR